MLRQTYYGAGLNWSESNFTRIFDKNVEYYSTGLNWWDSDFTRIFDKNVEN
jgi:hypothetical protein